MAEQSRSSNVKHKKLNIVQTYSMIPKMYSQGIKGSRFNVRRQPLDPIPVHGNVTYWDEQGFGFIEPEVDLRKIPGFTGKVFVHKNDLKFEMESLEEGAAVSFLLYRDDKGVGAHFCCLLEDEDKEEEQNITPVVSMLIPNRLLPRLIGRKGDTITALSENCEVKINVHNNPKQSAPNQLQVVTITGETECLQEGCVEITNTLTSGPASNSKIVFIIPEDQTGRFIGHGGTGINRIAKAHPNVSLSVSKMTVWYQGTEFNKIVIFGAQPKVKKCVKMVVEFLASLHAVIVKDYMWGRKRTITQNASRRGSRGEGRGSYNGRGRGGYSGGNRGGRGGSGRRYPSGRQQDRQNYYEKRQRSNNGRRSEQATPEVEQREDLEEEQES